MPLQATSGAASYDAFGGGVPVVPNYIEEVFSTYIYNGNGSTQTITNGIDLSTKGGLVWCKNRTSVQSHELADTVRGYDKSLRSNTTDAQFTGDFGGFNSNGFSLIYANSGNTNESGKAYVSWTFREQAKFFDIVTYTGTGSNTTIAHNLGAVPGCIIVKRTDTTGAWQVYHRSLANTEYLVLNTTAATATGTTRWNSTTPTSTVFSLGTDASVNASGGTYVAYIYAHDSGGFGLAGTDNVISCGSFTPSGGVATVNLGYEPQWVMMKNSTSANDWFMFDTMRGFSETGDVSLFANTSGQDTPWSPAYWKPTATGFTTNTVWNDLPTIYIAIRRGPMKVPTSGTSVFAPAYYASGLGTGVKSTTNFPVDMQMVRYTPGASSINSMFVDRLRGVSSASGTVSGPYLVSSATDAETGNGTNGWDNTGFYRAGGFGPSDPSVYHSLGRAPSVFDVVCYTGTGSARTVTHNLGAVPELVIVKQRNTAQDWLVYAAPLGNTKALYLNFNDASTTRSEWNNTTPTASVFSLNTDVSVNQSGGTFVAYLFATCPGVSKVGSYTGTATTKQIDCGFTGGARFVLIKKTSGTGSWYVWDSARGIVSGNDPYLLLNSTAAEVTNTDYIDTYSAGFEISSTAPSEINESGGSFIFLAIA